MLNELFSAPIEGLFSKVRAKAEISRTNPEIIWLASLAIGLVACLLIGFKASFFGLIIFLISFFISYIPETKDNKITCQLARFFIMGVVIFLIGIEQPIASSFVLFTLGALFFSDIAHNAIKQRKPDSFKDRAFHHPTKIISEYEILIFIILISLFYSAFAAITVLFAILCWVTIAMRGYDLFFDLKNKDI